jgi:hypothetical protein
MKFVQVAQALGGLQLAFTYVGVTLLELRAKVALMGSSLISLAGNPIFLAVVALGSLAAAFIAASQKAEDAVVTTGKFASLMNEVGDAAAAAAQKIIAQELATTDVARALAQAGISINDAADAIIKGGESTRLFINRLISLAGEGRISWEQMELLRSTIGHLGDQYKVAAEESNNFQNNLRALGDLSNDYRRSKEGCECGGCCN